MSVIMIVAFMPSMAFATGATGGNTWDKNGKFKVEIKSGDAHAFAEVYDDYSVLGKVIGEQVDAKSVSAKVTMKNVQSLGVTGERSHSVSFNPNLQYTPMLPEFFPHIFGCDKPNNHLYPNSGKVNAFNGATLIGKVNEYSFTYDVSAVTKENGEDNVPVYTMTATPNDTDAVRKAWHELTSKVEATPAADQTNDSKIEIPAGAYLQIGTQ